MTNNILIVTFIFKIVCFNVSCSFLKPENYNSYALVIGVSEYPVSSIRLYYASKDAKEVGNMLKENKYNTIILTDKDATVENINKSIDEINSKITKNDLFLFYFSGHGINSLEAKELNASINGNYSILVHNGASSSYEDPGNYVTKNSLSEKDLSRIFSKIKTPAKTAFIDACYSGGFISSFESIHKKNYNIKNEENIDLSIVFSNAVKSRSISFSSNFSSKGGIKDVLVVSSSKSNELSWEGYKNHSVFTYFFLTSKDYADLDNNKYITTLEIYAYIKAGIEIYWNSKNTDKSFLPEISHSTLDFVIF